MRYVQDQKFMLGQIFPQKISPQQVFPVGISSKERRASTWTFDGSILYGPISGYIQTPLGGAPSSASEKRPKFKELGIDNATLFNLSLSASMDQHSLYGTVHLVDLDGRKNLNETLVFHGVDYPAGTGVKSDVRLNWYEIGYKYNVDLGRERIYLRIAPTISFALFDFNAGWNQMVKRMTGAI